MTNGFNFSALIYQQMYTSCEYYMYWLYSTSFFLLFKNLRFWNHKLYIYCMRTKVILLLACFFILTTAFFLGTKESDKFKIYWNEKLIKGKTDYLAEKPEDVSSHERPNVIIILADDLGQTDISLYGGTKVSTPNIDAIGKNGATFSEGYISSPVCSPSRADC